jgi:predicted dehydrogenase
VTQKIRAAVIGAGAFGKNHARVYRQLQQEGQPVELAAVVDTDSTRGAQIAQEFSIRHFDSIATMLREAGAVQAASVAVPTVAHLEAAKMLMEAGIDVLIEKPLAVNNEQAAELRALAARHGRIVQVGHLERFNPAVQAALPLITKPMFFECHRLSIFTPRALDVDVVLDLMIHDLDIVLSFVGSPVREVRAVGLPILSHKIDIANVRVEFESGCVANFTASRVSTERVRKLRFFQPHQYVSIDYGRQDVFAIDIDEIPVNLPSAAAPPMPRFRKPEVKSGEPLRMEIEHFLQAVRTRQTPLVSLEDGSRALALALEITQSIEGHHRRANLDAIAQGLRS